MAQIITNALKQSCPTSKTGPGGFRVSKDTLELIKERRAIYYLKVNNPGQSVFSKAYNQLTKQIKRAIHSEKEQRIIRETQALNFKNSGAFWKSIDFLRGTTKSQHAPNLTLPNGTTTKDPNTCANLFA